MGNFHKSLFEYKFLKEFIEYIEYMKLIDHIEYIVILKFNILIELFLRKKADLDFKKHYDDIIIYFFSYMKQMHKHL